VDPELLEILVCPVCKESVRALEADKGLKCDACHRVYPIRNEIPVMIIDQATIEAPDGDEGHG
jgi:uncharacterized protein YbaR (Trm112 family)